MGCSSSREATTTGVAAFEAPNAGPDNSNSKGLDSNVGKGRSNSDVPPPTTEMHADTENVSSNRVKD